MGKVRKSSENTLDIANVLPEYPRPQLVREQWVNLNGYYEYAIVDEHIKHVENYQGNILVPFCVESKLSTVQKALLPNKHLWYQRYFDSPIINKFQRLILHFEAVDWQTTVYINRQLIGKHTGGYCPFSFDITDYITDYINELENQLEICVYDPSDQSYQQRGKQVLNPKGIWYTASSGIWQSIWLEVVADCYIENIWFTPNIDNKTVSFHVENNQKNDDLFYEVIIRFQSKSIFEGKIQNKSIIPIKELYLWSPESPDLYDVEVHLLINNQVKDSIASYFGMRKYSISKDEKGIPRLCLNNQPYFQKGVLDQGYWCESLMTAPNEESMLFDIRKAKELGFNMLRKHIKVETSRWYYLCDKLGMLVWQDMVSGGEYIGNLRGAVLPNLGIQLNDQNYKKFKRDKIEWREEFEKELLEIINHLRFFTSIYCWVPFNEGWGQFDAERIYQRLKEYDPSRMIDHASGWYDQGCGDLQSRHRYILPIPKPKNDGRPYVLSEYGGYSMIIKGHVYDEKKSFGYRMYTSSEKLSKAYLKLHQKQVIPLISKGLCAVVYTQLSDVENEVNGIFTYDREILKIDKKTIQDINQKLCFSND